MSFKKGIFYLGFIFLLLTPVLLKAQKTELDSLGMLLDRSKGDNIAKVKSLNLMSRALQEIASEKALLYAQQSLMLAEKINYQKGISDALYYIGSSYYQQDSYSKSLDYYLKAVKFYKSSGDIKGEAASFTTIGNIYFEFGDFDNALSYHLKAYKVYERAKDQTGLATALVNIGIVYVALNDFVQSMQNYKDALQIAEKINNKVVKGTTLNNMGAAFKKMKNYGKAIDAYQKAIAIFREINKKEDLANSINGLGDVFHLQGNINKSLAFHLEALEIQKEIKDRNGLAHSFMGIGDIYIEAKNDTRAIDYLKQSLEIGLTLQYKELIKENYRKLSKAYQNLGDYKTALGNYQLHKAYNDSIYNEKRLAQLAEMQTRFDVGGKEKAINLLNKESESQKKEIKAKERNIRQQALTIALFIGITVLVTSFVLLLYRSRSINRKINQQLTKQNDEIKRQKAALETQSEQLVNTFIKMTDSIRYAQTIQNSILPNNQKMKEILNDYFLISKAKDIVSGDFYWINQLDNKKFIAVVDCTGHGVAGGFTSMIGSALLNEIIIQKRVYQPSQILQILHKEVMSILEKRAPGIAVGMEAVLCMIEEYPGDIYKAKLVIAAARRPLFYISKNGQENHPSEVNELKGDRMPIGYYTDNSLNFTDKELILDKGSFIYLTSDGFVDQANIENKRFGTTRLKKILEDNAHKNLDEQKKSLENALKVYQSEAAQRDDITVLGVRI